MIICGEYSWSDQEMQTKKKSWVPRLTPGPYSWLCFRIIPKYRALLEAGLCSYAPSLQDEEEKIFGKAESAHRATNFQGQNHVNYVPTCCMFDSTDWFTKRTSEMSLSQTGIWYSFQKEHPTRPDCTGRLCLPMIVFPSLPVFR